MSRSKQPKEQVQGAEKFTAVILADSFTHDFKPITLDLPRALLPVCNMPLIDYTIEFLILNGVEEIFVLCSAHAEKLQHHVMTSRWANCKDLHIKVLVAKCDNPGDAIRHLNDYDVLRQDFILVSGDIISNFPNLKTLLRRHKDRREAEPSILLTLVFREEEYFGEGDSDLVDQRPRLQPTWSIGHGHPLIEEYVTVIMEPATGILHSCQPWVSRKFSCQEDAEGEDERESMRYLNVDLKLLKENPTLQCRSDLIDTNIVICSLELLSLFKQEFDFFDIKHDCVQSILEHDILGNKMAADIIRAPYFGRVVSFNHYAAVSQAILGRWLYPMVPESDFSGSGHPAYTPHDNNLYLGPGVKLCRGVTLGNDVLVGPRTVIEVGAVVLNCTIGANCRIGKNTKLTNTIILDNVHIGDNSVVESAILSSGVQVMSDVVVSPGTILAQNVQIAAGHTTIPNSRVYAGAEDHDPLVVGANGIGALWTPIGPQMRYLDVHMRVEPDDDEDSLDERFEELLVMDAQTVSTRVYARAGWRQPVEEDEKLTEEQLFFVEIEQLVHRALRENHQKDNSMLEIHGLKFGYNRTFQECARGAIRGFVTYFDDGKRNAKQFRDDMIRVLQKSEAPSSEGRQEDGWSSIFIKFVRSETACEVQLDMLDELLDLAKARKVVQAAFVHLLMFLHSEDILAEEGILKWVAQIDQNGTEEEKLIRSKCNNFIEWLQQEEDDEEEEEDDD